MIFPHDYWSDSPRYHPWMAPGYMPLWSPCGVKCWDTDENMRCGDDDGRKKKAIKPFPTWTSGSVVEVAYQHRVGHGGGGYSYRICPADSDLNEDCFAEGALSFAD